MNTPSPAALAIASLIEAAITPIFNVLSAPLLARIEELEKRPSATTDGTFNEAVLAVIRDAPGTVVDLIDDEIKGLIDTASSDDIENKIASVLRNGSFSVEFSRY